MISWLMEVGASFDGSDVFAFIGGCVAMILWKNIKAIKWNRSRSSGGDRSMMGTGGSAGDEVKGRKVSLPKLNARLMVYAMIIIVLVGTLWSSFETNNSIRQTAKETKAVAIAVCENAKVSGVERKALQDLLLASMNSPVQNLPQDHPDRRAYGQKLAITYLGALEDAAAQRKNIQEGKGLDPDFWERYFGPDYPEPDCYAAIN